MAKSLSSFAMSMFNDSTNSHLVLTREYQTVWTRAPRHVLSIPADWRKYYDGDFTLDWADFHTRKLALLICASQNRKAIEESPDEIPDAWSIIVTVGGWQSSSWLACRPSDGESSLHIKTSFTLVRPTAAEIAAAESEARHA